LKSYFTGFLNNNNWRALAQIFLIFAEHRDVLDYLFFGERAAGGSAGE